MAKGAPLNPSTAAAEYVQCSEIKPWGNNPRKNDAAVKGVVDSITRFGFGAPLLVRRETGEIIAGHTRYKAAQKLGLKTVPVRYMDLSADEAHALALADNKLGESADWDDEILRAVLQDLEAKGASLDGLGFDDADVKAMIGSMGPGAADDQGALDELAEKTTCPECGNAIR